MSQHEHAGQQEHAPEQEHAHSNWLYAKTWLYLLLLTVAAVGLEIWAGLPRVLIVATFLLIMLVKAALIAANFMHLRFEHVQLIAIAFVPLFLLLVMFLGMVGDFGGYGHGRAAAGPVAPGGGTLLAAGRPGLAPLALPARRPAPTLSGGAGMRRARSYSTRCIHLRRASQGPPMLHT